MSFGASEDGFSAACGGRIDRKTRVFIQSDPTCTPDRATKDMLYGPANPRLPNGTINYTVGGLDTVAFTDPNVTYVAASGDWGAKPMWPSDSNKVLSMGGINIQGATDVAWDVSGGGVSRHFPTPAHQAALGFRQRATPDVAMVADSRSAVSIYVRPQYVMPDSFCAAAKGAANCGWYGGYGTSAAAPMWAGLAAITRAMRAERNLPVVDFSASIYALATTLQYHQAFADVTAGIGAKLGFDLTTGLGVPKAAALTKSLSAYSWRGVLAPTDNCPLPGSGLDQRQHC